MLRAQWTRSLLLNACTRHAFIKLLIETLSNFSSSCQPLYFTVPHRYSSDRCRFASKQSVAKIYVAEPLPCRVHMNFFIRHARWSMILNRGERSGSRNFPTAGYWSFGPFSPRSTVPRILTGRLMWTFGLDLKGLTETSGSAGLDGRLP